ncbi:MULTISPECIES: glycosyltransferase [Moorena]|uniref:glycosyltransferase n=1 Tax=Moorena TaxID=1155738 RepID=UPI0025D18E0C|nr:hypothetical protein [Moorena sp. SIO4G3]
MRSRSVGFAETLHRILAQWYREATAVVFLSDREGFALPIAEAASFGRFVVVSFKTFHSSFSPNSS